MDLLKTTLYASIDDLLLKYEDDEYIKQKLENYLCKQGEINYVWSQASNQEVP